MAQSEPRIVSQYDTVTSIEYDHALIQLLDPSVLADAGVGSGLRERASALAG